VLPKLDQCPVSSDQGPWTSDPVHGPWATGSLEPGHWTLETCFCPVCVLICVFTISPLHYELTNVN